MRSFALIAFLGAVFCLAAAPNARAADGVLLPSCEGNLCPAPNLGLGASSPKSSASDKVTLPATAVDPAAAVAAREKAKLTTTITPGGSVGQDVKITPLQAAIQPKAVESSNPVIKAYVEKNKQMFNRPPLIINDFDNGDKINELANLYEKGLAVAVSSGYVWGNNDVKDINHMLGYLPQQIPQNCQLRMDAHLSSPAGLFGGNVYAGQTSTVRYNGAVKSVAFTPRAVCNPPKGDLPQHGGVIRKVGNKFSIQLEREVTCASAPANAARLEVQYGGDGTAVCKFN